jgi:acyl-coenzyme A thioesterase PaaI-like protein
VNLVAPASGEVVIARGSVLKAGRTLTVVRGDAFAVQGGREKLVATMLATVMTVRERGIVD